MLWKFSRRCLHLIRHSSSVVCSLFWFTVILYGFLLTLIICIIILFFSLSWVFSSHELNVVGSKGCHISFYNHWKKKNVAGFYAQYWPKFRDRSVPYGIFFLAASVHWLEWSSLSTCVRPIKCIEAAEHNEAKMFVSTKVLHAPGTEKSGVSPLSIDATIQWQENSRNQMMTSSRDIMRWC